MFLAHSTRLALRSEPPLLTPVQHAQNAAFMLGLVLLAALLW